MNQWVGKMHKGDTIEVLKQMPDNLVHCSITSPPYYSIKNYGEEDQMGREETVDEYIDYLVRMGEELKRVMRDDANFFLNIGDKFCTKPEGNIKRKDKMMVPHRVAIALQENGFHVRGDYLWKKIQYKPTSVKDRLGETKEFIFHLTNNEKYYFDLDSIREPHADISITRAAYGRNEGKHHTEFADKTNSNEDNIVSTFEGPGRENIEEKILRGETQLHPLGKNPGDIIEVAVETKVHSEHFAVFPTRLISPLIKAGCPQKVCKECKAPYERPDPRDIDIFDDSKVEKKDSVRDFKYRIPKPVKQCNCNTNDYEPGIVLDQFMGSGSTGVVAKRLNRQWIGIDLSEKYCNMATKRINNTSSSLDKFLESSVGATKF